MVSSCIPIAAANIAHLRYQQLIQVLALRASMSGKGNCYDNAACELLYTLKVEWVYQQTFTSIEQVEPQYILVDRGYYNPQTQYLHLAFISKLRIG